MKSRLTLLLASCLALTTAPAFAQITDTSYISESETVYSDMEPVKQRHTYFSNALDAGIFSSAILEKPGVNRELSYLRFTFGMNLGFHFNYDFDEHFGIYTGLGIKNIGFTDKISDSTIKRRVYTIGVPLGFKIGNLGGRQFIFLGGGIDVPFNYREKGWVNRKNKTKFSEWFSDRTPDVMPYLFAGASFKPGITFKVQFYPSNFLNTSFEEDADPTGYRAKPYRGYDARLLLLSIGFDIHYRRSEKPTNTPM